MKRISLITLALLLTLFTNQDYHSLLDQVEKSQETNVLIKFEKGVLSTDLYDKPIALIKSKTLRSVLKQYNVEYVQSVLKNRYDADGFLKNDLSKSDPYNMLNWQIATVEPSLANELYVSIKELEGVSGLMIDNPIQLEPALIPNDPEYTGNSLWHLNDISNPDADIDAEAAWDINTGRNDVVIAILDGGVDYTHPDLDTGDRSRIIAGTDTGENDNDPMDDLPDTQDSFGGHGTLVAGVVGAITDNGQQVSGVMWNCRIMPIKMVRDDSKFFDAFNWNWNESAFPSDVADAIDYAVNNGADVINLSYSFPSNGQTLDEIIYRLPLIYQAIDNAYQNNVVITASMGNNNNSETRYPAAFGEAVIAVGATNRAALKSNFSSYGSHINVAAPGSSIRSTERGGGVTTVSGTSFSAPITAGVAGLILSQGKDRGFDLTNDDVRHILELTAVDVMTPGFDEDTGHGIINAHHALQLLDEPNELYHWNAGDNGVKVANLPKWILLSGRWGIAAAPYFDVDQYEIDTHVTFDVPFCEAPEVWMRNRESEVLSGANPNSGHPFAFISNVTEAGFDLKYFSYFVRTSASGQQINKWIPAAPSSSNFEYSAVGEPNPAGFADYSSGPTLLCAGDQGTYTLSNVPAGASVS